MVVFYAINGYSAIHKLNFRTDDKVLPKSYTQVQISLIIGCAIFSSFKEKDEKV